MKLTHDNECEWRLGHDCTCAKKGPRDTEIARLQAEVKRLKRERDHRTAMEAQLRVRIERDIDTAWNDAIEAAAQVANDYDHYEVESAIRALRREKVE